MALTIYSTTAASQAGPATPHAAPAAPQRVLAKRRVFRADDIPLEWSKQVLSDRLQEYYSGHKLHVDSFYKYPTGTSNTSLVTFFAPVPQSLPPDDEPDRRDWIELGDDLIALGHCLGLTTLFEPGDGQSPKVDVVFVHGIGGHPIGSWMAANGRFWPRDFLGSDLEGARVLSFGYEAKLNMDTSTSQLSDFGRQLLMELPEFRPTAEDQERPLFFVGHSYGGTIISWVLNELSSKKETRPSDGDVLRAIRCATFFGTPHSGMSVEPLEALVLERVHENMRRTLGDLKPNSELLKVLHEHLRRLSATTKIRVISCVEQKLTRAPSINGQPGKLYQPVNLSTARTYAQTEDDAIPIHADHREMVKFDRKTDPGYRQVFRQLKQALDDCGQTSTIRTLTGEQRQSLLASLATPALEDYQATIKDAHESSCGWLLRCWEYERWSDTSKNTKDDDPILWIKGKAGSGKSTIMKFALTQQHPDPNNHLAIAFFFTDRGPPIRRSVKGMYHSLLLQVLKATESVPSEVPALEHRKRDPNSTWQAPALKELLEAVVPRLGRPVLCFIDALDECEASEAREVELFCRGLAQLCAKKGTVFRACFSSRHHANLSAQQQRSLFLEEQDGHKRDILTYIEHKLPVGQGEPARRIRQSMQQKASGVFLWAVIAAEALRNELACGRISMLQQRLDEMPADLPGLYRHVLTRNSSNKLLHCLRVVLFSQKPHSPMSLYHVLTVLNAGPDALGMMSDPRAQSRSMEDQARDFLIDASKGLVEVIGPHSSVVQFVHASVPDFLHSNEAISQVWRESPDTFLGKSHDILKGCYLSLIQNLAIPAPCAPEHGRYLEYLEHPGWQNDQGYLERGFGGPVEHYYEQPRQGYAETVVDELFLPHHATGAAMQYYHGAIHASHHSHPQAASFPSPPPPPLDDPLSVAAQYAVEHILYHSNEAEKDGVNQARFLQNFPLPQYIELKNTLAASHGQQPEAYAEDTSLLHVLAGENSAELLTMLLDSPSRMKDFDRKDPHSGRTPLAAAAARGNVEVVRLMLSSGKVDLESRGADGRTPLALAASGGRVETLRLLLASGKVSLEPKDADGRTPLALAAFSGSVETVRLLLNCKGVRVNVQDNVGRTPLSLAAQAGVVGVLELLYRAGADPKLGDAGRRTPLSFAAEEGLPGVAKFLIEVCRVERCAKDIHGASPLDYADWRRESLTADEFGLVPEYDAVIGMLRKDNSQPRLVESYRAAVRQQKPVQHGRVLGHEPRHPQPGVNQSHQSHGLQHHAPSYHHALSYHQQPHDQHAHSQRKPQYAVLSPHEAASHHGADFHHVPHIQPAADWQYDVYSPQIGLGSREYDYDGHSDTSLGYGSGGHKYEDESDGDSHGRPKYHEYEGNGYGHHDDEDGRYKDEGGSDDGQIDDGCDEDDSDDEGYSGRQ